MRQALIQASDTPETLAIRLNRPLCMVLRANQLFSTAWLLPGREIDVPDADFCQSHPDFPCMRDAVQCVARPYVYYAFAKGDTVASVALRFALTERMVRRAAHCLRGPIPTGTVVSLPCVRGQVMDRVVGLGRMPALTLQERALNDVWGPLYPGMHLLYVAGHGKKRMGKVLGDVEAEP